jgi:ribosomal protein S18 acetylase RimI-like enzyme
LIEVAKRSGEAALELWCFQANTYARRFYERHGFKAIRFTDGHDNEEKTPDVRYRWARDADELLAVTRRGGYPALTAARGL